MVIVVSLYCSTNSLLPSKRTLNPSLPISIPLSLCISLSVYPSHSRIHSIRLTPPTPLLFYPLIILIALFPYSRIPLSLYPSLSLSIPLHPSLSLHPCIPVFPYFSITLSLSIPLSLYSSISLSLSTPLTRLLSYTLYPSYSSISLFLYPSNC